MSSASTVAVAIGIVVAGAIGTTLRVLLTDLGRDFGQQLAATLTLNVAGSFILGTLVASDQNMALIVGVGGLGALTTFSTFIAQVEHINRHATGEKAAAYVLAAMILGVTAALLGIAISS